MNVCWAPTTAMGGAIPARTQGDPSGKVRHCLQSFRFYGRCLIESLNDSRALDSWKVFDQKSQCQSDIVFRALDSIKGV